MADYPQAYMDRRPKKRARLDWDPSHTPKVFFFFFVT